MIQKAITIFAICLFFILVICLLIIMFIEFFEDTESNSKPNKPKIIKSKIFKAKTKEEIFKDFIEKYHIPANEFREIIRIVKKR